jgi:hypothetical protein
MGLFNRKKKNAGAGAPGVTGIYPNNGVNGELAAVLSASVAAYEDDNLAAVISAAVAAYEGAGFTTGLRVRKINRNTGFAPAWGVMGIREAMDARRF